MDERQWKAFSRMQEHYQLATEENSELISLAQMDTYIQHQKEGIADEQDAILTQKIVEMMLADSTAASELRDVLNTAYREMRNQNITLDFDANRSGMDKVMNDFMGKKRSAARKKLSTIRRLDQQSRERREWERSVEPSVLAEAPLITEEVQNAYAGLQQEQTAENVEQRHEDFKTLSRIAHENMSQEQQIAVEKYIRDSADYNYILRGIGVATEEQSWVIRNLRSVMTPLPVPINVYRSVVDPDMQTMLKKLGLPNSLKLHGGILDKDYARAHSHELLGRTFQDAGFTSTTIDADFSLEWSQNAKKKYYRHRYYLESWKLFGEEIIKANPEAAKFSLKEGQTTMSATWYLFDRGIYMTPEQIRKIDERMGPEEGEEFSVHMLKINLPAGMPTAFIGEGNGQYEVLLPSGCAYTVRQCSFSADGSGSMELDVLPPDGILRQRGQAAQ